MGVRVIEAGPVGAAEVDVVAAAPAVAPLSVPRAAAEVAYEVDAKGRRIGVRRVNALALYRLTKVLGETASNQASLNLALSVASVVEINGDPVAFPATEAQVEALMARLDFEGMAAATTALKKLEPNLAEVAAAAGN